MSLSRREFLGSAGTAIVLSQIPSDGGKMRKMDTRTQTTNSPGVISVTYYLESREEAAHSDISRGQFFLNRIGSNETTALLRKTRSSVSMALNEYEIRDDAACVEFLKEYTLRGIPVDLWANLQDEKGYWIYAGNIDEARVAILEMVNRAERAGVRFRNIGLDLEMKGPNLGPSAIWENFRFAPDEKTDAIANEKLRRFVDEVLNGGTYGVDTYELPIMSDCEVLRRRLGILRAPEISNPHYRRVAMVYRTVYETSLPSVFRRSTPEFIRSYSSRRGRLPALGIISANKKNPGRGELNPQRLLTDQQLEEDCRAVLAGSNELFVFALNGLSVIQRVRRAIVAAARQISRKLVVS